MSNQSVMTMVWYYLFKFISKGNTFIKVESIFKHPEIIINTGNIRIKYFVLFNISGFREQYYKINEFKQTFQVTREN